MVAYDVRILPAYQVSGRPTIDRSYVLLDQGVQLARSAVLRPPVDGWWYVDLVDVDVTEAGLVVHDLYIDFLVPPSADRYVVLDLDELGDALRQGQLTVAQCATVLTRTQRFIDRHLRASSGPPPPFPPESIAPLMPLPCLLD